MPWAIKIVQFSEKYKKEASYEPELHPGVTYNLHNPTATLKIFSTGSMTVTGEYKTLPVRLCLIAYAIDLFVARSVANVQAAIEHIYPLVYEFKKPRVPKEVVPEEEVEVLQETFEDSEDDDDSDVGVIEEDPLQFEPPKKKQKLRDVRDVSHLTKRFKGGRTSKRPPGKMNDPSEDLIYVSDGDMDGDDPDDF